MSDRSGEGGRRIFVSIRLEEGEGRAYLLAKRLLDLLGPGEVLLNVDDDLPTRPDESYQDQLLRRFSDCALLLGVVGPGWAQAAEARRSSGRADAQMAEFDTADEVGLPMLFALVDGAPRPQIRQADDAVAFLVGGARFDQEAAALAERLRYEVARRVGPPFRITPPPPEAIPRTLAFAPGTFEMGSSPDEGEDEMARPQRSVSITAPFALGALPVKTAEYKAFWDAAGVGGPELTGEGADPVVGITWREAENYCRWLDMVAGGGWRLPSEAEWEFARRSTREGDGDSERLQMVGEVWEMCSDCWNDNHQDASTDGAPRHWGQCDMIVLRGGASDSADWARRPASRVPYLRESRAADVGFRVARSLAPSDP